MKQVTVAEMVQIFRDHKGAMPISFTALVDTRARKTNNPYDQILKFSEVNAFTGHDYENSVNRQRVREGSTPDFVERGRSWGTNINNILVENKGQFYLRVRPLHTSEPIYFAKVGKTIKKVAKEAIEHLLPPVYHSQIQDTAKEIIHREYLVSNLRTVTLNGSSYELVVVK